MIFIPAVSSVTDGLGEHDGVSDGRLSVETEMSKSIVKQLLLYRVV